MQGINFYVGFNINAFLDGKKLLHQGTKKWADYQSKEILGSRIDCVIIEDKTVYPKEGISNRYEKITFKVPHEVNIPVDAIVVPVNPVATVYGEYRNQLSIKCDDIKVVSQPSK